MTPFPYTLQQKMHWFILVQQTIDLSFITCMLTASNIPWFCKLFLEIAKAIEIFEMMKSSFVKQSFECKKSMDHL
jgi:hypothetical protein